MVIQDYSFKVTASQGLLSDITGTEKLDTCHGT